jgi:O-antigen ligase
VVGAAIAVLTAEVAVAGALTQPQLARLLPLVLGTLALAFIFTWPLASTIGLLLLSASVLPGFVRSAGPIQVRVQELLLFALLLVAIVAPRSRRRGGVPGVALAAFLGLVVLSACVAIQDGNVDAGTALAFGRPLVFFASFWIVLRLFPDAESLRTLLIGGVACGAIAGLLAVPVALGSGVGASLHQQAQNVTTPVGETGIGGLLRVRFPGVALSYILFWWSILAVLTSRGRTRVLLGALGAASAVNIVLSYNRNMWLGIVVGLALLIVLFDVRARERMLLGIAVGASAVVLMFTIAVESHSSSQIQPVFARAGTLLDPEQLAQERSLRDRADESKAAWTTITRHPLLGVGVGADYGVRFNLRSSNGTYVDSIQRFLHDQWLWLLLIGGVPTLAAFAAFVGSVLLKAWAPSTRTLSQTALGVGLAMVMVSSFVMISLSATEFCLAIGVVSGVVVAMHELERQRDYASDSGATDA